MPGINRFGNTKNVLKTHVKKLWVFPSLSMGGTDRVFTKHFANLALWLDPHLLALLSFLVYRSEKDNTIKYTTRLLKQYAAAVKLIQSRYKKKEINSSPPLTRQLFKDLIENGLLLPTTDEKFFLVNPMLTYSKERIRPKFYDSWCVLYGEAKIEEIQKLTTLFRKHE